MISLALAILAVESSSIEADGGVIGLGGGGVGLLGGGQRINRGENSKKCVRMPNYHRVSNCHPNSLKELGLSG